MYLGYLILIWLLLNLNAFIVQPIIFNSNIDRKNTYQYFIIIIITVLFWIIVYSIIITKFRTINSLILLILLGYFLKEKTKLPNPFKFKLLEVVEYLKSNFLQTTVALLIYHFVIPYYNLTNDSYFYLNISEFLSQANFETLHPFYNVFKTIQNYNYTEPYHFFDLWFSALFLNVSGLNNLLIFKSILLPLFNVFLLLALYALGGNKKGVIFYLICVTAIININYFPFNSSIFHYPNFVSIKSVITPKFILPVIYLSIYFNEARNKKFQNLLLLNILFSLLHPIFFVAFFVHVLSMIGLKIFESKTEINLEKKTINKLILSFALLALSYYFIYKIASPSKLISFENNSSSSIFKLIQNINLKHFIKGFLRNTNTFIYFINVLIIIALLTSKLKQSLKNNLIFTSFIVCLLIFIILIQPLTEFIVSESVQLITFFIFFPLFFVQFLIYNKALKENFGIIKIISLIIILSHISYFSYSQSQQLINNKKHVDDKIYATSYNNKIGAGIINFDRDLKYKTSLNGLFIPYSCNEIKLKGNRIYTVPINVPDKEYLSNYLNSLPKEYYAFENAAISKLYNEPFFIYNSINFNKSLTENQLDFLIKYKFDFLITNDSNLVDNSIKKHAVNQEIMNVNEVIYYFKN